MFNCIIRLTRCVNLMEMSDVKIYYEFIKLLYSFMIILLNMCDFWLNPYGIGTNKIFRNL